MLHILLDDYLLIQPGFRDLTLIETNLLRVDSGVSLSPQSLSRVERKVFVSRAQRSREELLTTVKLARKILKPATTTLYVSFVVGIVAVLLSLSSQFAPKWDYLERAAKNMLIFGSLLSLFSQVGVLAIWSDSKALLKASESLSAGDIDDAESTLRFTVTYQVARLLPTQASKDAD